MAIYQWISTTGTTTVGGTTNLRLIKTPVITYVSGVDKEKQVKDIHEFIKGVVLKKNIWLDVQYTYE